MQANLTKQRVYPLQDGIQFSSNFESGNLSNVIQKQNLTFHLSVEADPHSSYKTWFFFSVSGIEIGNCVTFVLVNMSNQVKLFKQGHLPVYKNEQEQKWSRIRIPIQQNGVSKGEEGFQMTFKHLFSSKSKHYFAFSYPWTYSDCNIFIQNLISKNKQRYFCDYRPLCQTTKKMNLNILTVTKITQQSQPTPKNLNNFEKYAPLTFKNKKGIFISARVHPGEVASSHILNGFLKFLFSRSPQSEILLEKCVFYIVPILNPDGVSDGNFRCDSLGFNLNRFYTDPSPEKHPQIFSVKTLVIDLIKSSIIHFCLDLHAHVNKQGVFMYGNSTSSLKDQVQICLFPKLLQYNSRFFDFQSCNFSEKNMTSKDQGDQLSKQGASRVTFFKETGLTSCWTLECNYNSSKFVNQLPKEAEEQTNVKQISHGLLTAANDVVKKEELTYLNIKEFQEIGKDIGITILDYYRMRKINRYSSTLLKNWTNLHLSLACKALRMIPFRFDNQCRKYLNNLNSSQTLNETFSKIIDKLNLEPIGQYLSIKDIKQRSKEKQYSKDPKDKKTFSQKIIPKKSASLSLKDRSVPQKQSLKTNIIAMIPNIPRFPLKKR